MHSQSSEHSSVYPIQPTDGDRILPQYGRYDRSNGYDGDDEAPLDIRRIIAVFLLRKWLLVFSVTVALALAFVLTIRETPTYRAVALVQAIPPAIKPFGYTDYAAAVSSKNYTGDQVQLLRSVSFAQKVAKGVGPGFGIQRHDAPDSDDSFFAQLEAGISRWIGELRGEPRIEETGALRFREVEDGLESERRAIEQTLRANLGVKPVSSTNSLRLTLDSPDPRAAAALVNAVAKTYVRVSQERRAEGSEATKEFYEQQIRKTRLEITELERRLVAYARGKDLVDLDNLLHYHEQEFTELKSQLLATEQKLYQAEAKYTAMRDTGGGFVGKDFLDNEVMQQLKTRRAELEDQYTRNLEVFLPGYPEMQKLNRQIETIEDQIVSERQSIAKSIEAEYLAAKRERESLAQRVEEQREKLLSIRDETADYNALKREHSTLLAVFDGLMSGIKEARIVSEVGPSNVWIVDLATVPKKPFKPDLQSNLLSAAALGLIAGVLLILLLEKLDDTVKSAHDVEELTSAPILGSMPFVGARGRDDDTAPVSLSALRDAKSPILEAARSLRTALLFSSAGGAPKVLAVTGSSRGEGKTSSLVAVAAAFAQSGSTVLCIDADLRDPSLHDVMSLDNAIGLTNYLVSDTHPSVIAQATSMDGVYAITSGPLPPNPVELLSSEKMRDLLQLAGERFDYVFIDGPPVIGLADAVVISKMAGASVFVVEPGQTRKGALRESLKRLRASQVRIVGTLLQKVGRNRNTYGYGYGYGYGYRYDYNYQYMYGYGRDRDDETDQRQLV